MSTSSATLSVESLEIRHSVQIEAPPEIVFESVLDQLGPEGLMPGDKPFPMVLEAWPGGRWYRDTGNKSGHLWAHVQVIKPPKLIELIGPLMMSYATVNHLQYRLTAEGKSTRLDFRHSAVGLIEPEHRDGLRQGWDYWVSRISRLAEQKVRK